MNIISIFSGGGGLDLGLESVGFKTLFASDIDPYSCATLQKGKNIAAKKGLNYLKDSIILREDINHLKGSFVLDVVGLKKGEVDLLAGGPPCQAFSVFGRRMGRSDPRGKLVYEYFRLLNEIQPESFLFENVYGLMTVEKGEVFKHAVAKLQRPSPRLFYKISVLRMDAVNFGVPQYRDRIFIIGSRKGNSVVEPDILTIPPDELPLANHLSYRTVGDAFRGLTKIGENGVSNHTGRDHSNRIIERYSEMAPGQRDDYTRINKLNLKRPSFTIIVGSDKGGGKGHIHPIEPREVTPRESARIQTFPDWWEFTGTVRHPIRQIGNAVPPLLSFAVGNVVRQQIFGKPSASIKSAVEMLSQQHLFPEWYKKGK